MEIVLHDFQSESVEGLRNNIRNGIKNQVLSAPTGSGKTVVGAHLLDECYKKGRRAVFVADRINLIDQTSVVLDRYGIPHGVIQADHWRKRLAEPIQVASAETLARREWPVDLDLIIVDECHAIRKTITDRISRRDTITIGLSATPFVKGLGQFYDGIVTVTTTNKLIAEGHLSPFRIFAASEPDMTGAETNSFGEWTDQVAADRSMPIVGDCVTEYLKNCAGQKFIAFGVKVSHCEEMQRQFMAAGIQCALYTYQTGDDERTQILQEFRKPDSFIRGLLSVSALSKGFDVTDIECVILARPLRKSLAEHIQMMGRGLRMHEGKGICTFLDHSGNCTRFWNEMIDFFENGCGELDDGKRPEKKKGDKEQEPIKCPICKTLHKPMPACPSCGHIYPKKGITHLAGELKEIIAPSAPILNEKQTVYSMLLWMAEENGFKPGWVGHKFKERIGVWPRGLQDIPMEPSSSLRKWVKARQISWYKSQRA